MTIIEYLRWQVRLWLVEYGQRVTFRMNMLAINVEYPEGRFSRFVDRVSPWVINTGYRRRSLRRILYILRYPLRQSRFLSLMLVERVVYQLAPRPFLGRYESWEPALALKAEWLDDHSEYAGETTGDSDTYIWAALFHLLDVPWSLKPETWTLTVDSRGFVEARRDDGAVDFTTIANIWSTYEEANDSQGGTRA